MLPTFENDMTRRSRPSRRLALLKAVRRRSARLPASLLATPDTLPAAMDEAHDPIWGAAAEELGLLPQPRSWADVGALDPWPRPAAPIV